MSRLIPEEERNKAYLKHHQLISNLRSEHFLKEYSVFIDKPGLPVEDEITNSFIEENIVAIKLKNNGDLPSTNVQVKLLIRMYGSKNIYPKDNVDKNTVIEREYFDEKEINIPIPYIGANEKISYKIIVHKGQFRETELFLLSIKANGFTYVKNNLIKNFFYPNSKIILNHYKHPFVGLMEQELIEKQSRITADHIKMFYGFSEKEE